MLKLTIIIILVCFATCWLQPQVQIKQPDHNDPLGLVQRYEKIYKELYDKQISEMPPGNMIDQRKEENLFLFLSDI